MVENGGDRRAKHDDDARTPEPARIVGRFAPGHRGGPGRPRGQSATAELRRQVDVEAVARRLLDMIDDPTTGARERLGAIAMVFDRLDGRPISRSVTLAGDMSVEAVQALMGMTPDERLRWIDAQRASRALPGATNDE